MEITKQIYAIDDNSDYRLLVSQVFRKELPTYGLRFFESGDALVHHLFRGLEKPGLILLDRHMPGRDGYRTLEMLKKHPDWQIVPVIMLSSQASPQAIEACYRAGANSFLHKPVDLDGLSHLLRSLSHYWLELNQI